jgi:uncharacterized protein (TIRG00374 family)
MEAAGENGEARTRADASREKSRALPIALFLAGLAVVGWLLWHVGWGALVANLALVGWWFPALVCLYGIFEGAFAFGWQSLMPGPPPLRTMPRIFAAYIAGDAVNYATPGNVAGEPVKGKLVADLIRGSDAAASLALHKHAELLAQSLYMGAGVAVAVGAFPMPKAAVLLAVLGVAILAGAFVFMTWALKKGSFAPILGRLTRIAWLERRLSRFETHAREVDEKIRAFHVEHPVRFALVSLLCLVGWCGALVETYVLLGLLSHVWSVKTALAIDALAMAAGNLLLFMPGRVGSAEGSRVAVFLLLGFPAAQGVAYSLVRRGRELVWVALGAIVVVKRHVKW